MSRVAIGVPGFKFRERVTLNYIAKIIRAVLFFCVLNPYLNSKSM